MVSRDDLVSMLDDMAKSKTVPEQRVDDSVTQLQLTAVLKMLEERHEAILHLLDTRFRHLEDTIKTRFDQNKSSEGVLDSKIKDESARNDKRFTQLLLTLIVMILGIAAKIFFGGGP